MRVLKFGGTSVATAARIKSVAALLARAAAREEVVVVVSALAGVTDALVAAAERAAAGDAGRAAVAALRRRHLEVLSALGGNGSRAPTAAAVDARLAGLGRNLARVAARGRCTPEERDEIAATGERLCAPLVAAALRGVGVAATAVDASELIVTDSRFGAAVVDENATSARVTARLKPLARAAVPVVTGFVAADLAGRTTTLGRGGSDYSAAIVGAGLSARVVEIWTDVDGVLTAPPRLLPGGATIAALSYEEAAELAFLGAKVLHRDTMRPLAALAIPVAVRNTLAPERPGTLISGASPRAGVAAVTAVERVVMLEAAPAPNGAAVELPSAGIAPLAATRISAQGATSLVVAADGVERTVAALAGAWSVTVREGLALVAAVGHGLGRDAGRNAAGAAALFAAGVAPVALWAGAAPHSLTAVVARRDLTAALAALHGALVRQPRGTGRRASRPPARRARAGARQEAR